MVYSARTDNTSEEPVDEFILSEQGYIEMADDSTLLDFPFRRDQSEKSFKAMPICNNKSLGLELKCDDCAPGYPYVELCVQFQDRANEAFKVCGAPLSSLCQVHIIATYSLSLAASLYPSKSGSCSTFREGGGLGWKAIRTSPICSA